MSDVLAAIEQAAVRGWPALATEMVDGWLCRATSGGSIRANSVAALSFTGRDLGAAIARVERFYAAHGAPAVFTISTVSEPAGLDAELARRGYRRSGDHVTMAKAIGAPPPLPSGVTATDVPDPAWLAVYLSGLSADRRDIAPRILAGVPPGLYVSARREGVVVGCGLTIPDGPLSSVQCMATLPQARRSGAASDVLAAIEHHAARAGARHLYLQTDEANIAARGLYSRAGYALAGRYHTRVK